MNCENARELLEQIMSGKLSGEEARSVRLHFASCPDCAAGLNTSQWMEILPAMDETIEPPGDFAPRFHAKLQSRPQPWWKRIQAWGLPRKLAAAGALASIILVGVLVIRYPFTNQDRLGDPNEFGVAQNLPLLEDMPVVSNLDLLEDFDAIENLPHLMKEPVGSGQ
jgi:hypothetical protein